MFSVGITSYSLSTEERSKKVSEILLTQPQVDLPIVDCNYDAWAGEILFERQVELLNADPLKRADAGKLLKRMLLTEGPEGDSRFTSTILTFAIENTLNPENSADIRAESGSLLMQVMSSPRELNTRCIDYVVDIIGEIGDVDSFVRMLPVLRLVAKRDETSSYTFFRVVDLFEEISGPNFEQLNLPHMARILATAYYNELQELIEETDGVGEEVSEAGSYLG